MDEEGECDELTSLETRHRKERKELQAQITALKKTAKNDKTKKKELATEIGKLETKQEIRHKQELEAVKLHSVKNTSAPETDDKLEDKIENNIPKLKLSKAQKRRDKKQKQEKEREVEIKLQEKENLNGPRNTEVQAICERLKKIDLKMYSIPSDGDCLYKAVAHQLQVKRQQSLTVDELRKNVAEYIRAHKLDFISFMSHPETCEMLTDTEFKDYCDKISNTKVWGGQLEIRALSNSLKCPISVIQATGPESIEQGIEYEGPALMITYHRHMYSLGEHYNSTCPNEAEE